MNKYPITYQQEKLILYNKMNPDDTSYNMAEAVRIHGKLDKERLNRALEAILSEDLILKVIFQEDNGKFYQIYREDACYQIQYETVREEELNERLEAEKLKKFDIETENLMRLFVFQISEDVHIFFMVIHHILCDGWSLSVIFQKFLKYYSKVEYTSKLSYLDYALQQEDRKKSKEYCVKKEYWEKETKDFDTTLNLSSDFAEIKKENHEGNQLLFPVSEELTERIREFCKKQRITPFIFLFSAFGYFLYRYTGQKKFVIGVPFSNRMNNQWKETIGFFVNTLPLKFDFSENKTILEYLKTKYLELMNALTKSDVEIQTAFHVAFAFQSKPTLEKHQISGLLMEPVRIHNHKSKFDLQLSISEQENNYLLEWEYPIHLFLQESIKDMNCHMVNIIEKFLENPQMKVKNTEILSEEELKIQKDVWNETKKEYRRQVTLPLLFEEAVEKYSSQDAVKFGQETYTYSELNGKVNALCIKLKQNGVTSNAIIAILFERSLELLISLYAIEKLGCAYLPIATHTPKERIDYIIKDAGASILLTADQAVEIEPTECPVITVNRHELETGAENPKTVISEDADAYVIYTSGSTGNPKGVVNTHRGICNRILWMQDAYHLQKEDCILQKTPYTFDVSVWEFFWPLLFGAKLVIAKPEGHKDPEYLVETIVKEKITVIHFVPSMLKVFLSCFDCRKCTSLRNVMCSGEALTRNVVTQYYQNLKAPLINLYGPTEAAVDVSYWDTSDSTIKEIVPIGRPISNLKLYKLSEDLKFTPYHVPGELYISGIGLARGYLNNEQLTNEKFIKNPWDSGDYDRIYKTGDLVKFIPDGNIVYLDRIDNQVKLNGQRIELEEIERKILEIPEIKDAVVVVNKNGLGDQYLIGFYVSGKELETSLLIGHLSNSLMEYMIPKVYCRVEKIPLSANGKIDRKELLNYHLISMNDIVSPPETKMEKIIVEIFEKVLKKSPIGREDNFFYVGGNSLRIAEVVLELGKRLQHNVSFDLLMHYPVVKDLAEKIERQNSKEIGRTNISLDREINFQIDVKEQKESEQREKRILLTGATGFLGAYLLREFLMDENSQLYCLVRSKTEKEGMERIRSNMSKWKLWKEDYEHRIQILCGDLSKDALGLKKAEIDNLKEKIDILCHNGAVVNFSLPYESLKKTNVGGTEEILKIMAEGKKKKMLYISTFAIFSGEDFKNGIVKEDSMPMDINFLTLGYTQSKMVSEMILDMYRKKGLDIDIIRVGRIIGDGINKLQNDDLFWKIFELCRKMKAYPDIDNGLDFLPVDIVSRLVKYLVVTKHSPATYHLVNPNTVKIKDIGAKMSEREPEIIPLSWEQWYEKCKRMAEDKDHLAQQVLIFFSEMLPEESRKFNMENMEEIIRESKTDIPKADLLLNKYF